MRNNHFSMLPSGAFQRRGKHIGPLWGDDGGGSSAPTTTTVQNSNLPEYVQPYVTSMLGAAQQQMFNMSPPDATGAQSITGFRPYTPYSANPTDYVAAFSPMQQQAQNSAYNLTLPGQFGGATAGTVGAMNQFANNTYNPLASGYMSSAAPSLANYSMANPGNVSAAYTGAANAGIAPMASASGFYGPGNVGASNVYAPSLSNYSMGPASNVATQDFTAPGTANKYMSPYLQNALDPQIAELRRQYGITGTQQQSQATGAGAFGGSREALMAAENARNMNSAINNVVGQGYNTAFGNAQAQFNAQQNANLQAQQANQQAGLTTGQQNLSAALGVQQLGAQTGLQAQQLNQAAGLQAGLANQQTGYNTALQNAQMQQQANLANQALQGQYGLQNATMAQQANLANQQAAQQANLANQQTGLTTNQQNLAAQLGIQQLGAGQNLQSQLANQQAYQTAQALAANQQQFGANYGLQNLQQYLAGANQLGNLGTNQLAAQQGIINAQTTAGTQQQAQQQNIINQAIQNYAQQQQMPMQSLSNLSALLHGLPLQNTTTQSYQAAPSTISQIAGLGTGALGLSKLAGAKAGGSVKDIKKMAGGGIASLENRQRIAANYTPQQIQQEVQRGVLPQGIGGVLSQDYTNMQKAAQGAQAQQAAMQAAQPQNSGVTGLPSNLPVQGMAQGGIIAFAGNTDGSLVKDPLHWSYAPEKPDYTEADAILTAAQAQPHTMDDVAAARSAEETKRGITDVYTPMLSDLKAKEAALAGKQDKAQGLALLAAGAKMMGSTSPYAGVGLGAGLGEYATNYGAASEKLDALKENYSQQNNNIMLAQNAYKEAALNNDTNRMDKAKSAITTAQENKQKITQHYNDLVDTGNLEKAKETGKYYTEIDKEKQISGREKDTDLRDTTNIYYKDMVENKNYPANSATLALARQSAYKDIGQADRRVAVLENTAEANLTHQQNQDLAVKEKAIDKKYGIERMGAFGDAQALAIIDAKIAAEKDAAKQEILRGTTKPGAGAGSSSSTKTSTEAVPLTATKLVDGKTVTITSTDGGKTWKDEAGKVVK